MHLMKRPTKAIALCSLLAMSLLVACDNVNRSLLFYTTTNVGIEVGIDPAQPAPKLIIGYKRAEGVLNPVYVPPCPQGTCGTCQACQGGVSVEKRPDHYYRSEAYSVMAKLKGKAVAKGSVNDKSEVSGSGEVAQWFATGKAAQYLAKNEYAAAALTGNSSIGTGKLSNNLSELDPLNFASQLQNIYDGLQIWSADDPDAQKHIDAMDKLASRYFLTLRPLTIYRNSVPVTKAPMAASTFSEMVTVPSRAKSTIVILNTLIAASPAHGGFTLTELQTDLQLAEFHLGESEEQLYTSSAVTDAVNYFADKLTGK